MPSGLCEKGTIVRLSEVADFLTNRGVESRNFCSSSPIHLCWSHPYPLIFATKIDYEPYGCCFSTSCSAGTSFSRRREVGKDGQIGSGNSEKVNRTFNLHLPFSPDICLPQTR
jgi:hypothetical protein